MKKQLKLIVALLAIYTSATATVRTVNNNGGGQFIDIATALAASTTGDTIYICGSATAYTAPTVRKNNITFIGAGLNVQKQLPVKTTIGNLGNFNIGTGNILIGLEILCQINYLDLTADLNISRCYLSSSLLSSGTYQITNLSINQCVITSTFFSIGKFTNLLVANTLFYASTTSSFLSNFQQPGNAHFVHCSFAGGSTQTLFTSPPASGFAFSNCIFYGSTLTNVPATYSFFNCMVPAAVATGSGNIVSTVWPFVQTQGSVTGTYNGTWNFNVLPTSVAHNAAIDSTDLGIYGSTTPYIFDGEPNIPQMDVLNINGTQFNSGGTMNINFQSSVHE